VWRGKRPNQPLQRTGHATDGRARRRRRLSLTAGTGGRRMGRRQDRSPVARRGRIPALIPAQKWPGLRGGHSPHIRSGRPILRHTTAPKSTAQGCRPEARMVQLPSLAHLRTRAGGTGLALVLCTGAALRRPSVWPAMRHREGCSSPAIGHPEALRPVAWGNPANRGTTGRRASGWPAGL
jgi:hypothetical protein